MAKVTLTVNCDINVFTKACEVYDVSIHSIDTVQGMKLALVSFKHPAQLYNVGVLQEHLTLSDVKGEVKKDKKK